MANNTDNIVPWGLHPIKGWVLDELVKRAGDYGYKSYTSNNTKRVGAHAVWTRVFSNGIPSVDGVNKPNGLEGFLIGGVHGFKDSLGFRDDKVQYIGTDANGNYHKIPVSEYKTQPHRPIPNIESIDVELAGGQNAPFSGMCRKTTIKWKCYSLDQLEYLTPYFLSPKVSCVIEWGWDNYNPASLAPLNDINKLAQQFENVQYTMDAIYKSNGNYDRVCGIITDYSFGLDAVGGYDCQTTVMSVSWLFDGIDMQNQSLVRIDKNGKEEQIENFKEFVEYSGLNNEKPRQGLPPHHGRYFQPTDNKGKLTTKKWIRFDYFVELVNHFFSSKIKEYQVKDGDKTKNWTYGEIDITNVLINSHPGLKSTNLDLLLPSQISPQYVKKSAEDKKSVKRIESTDVYELFKSTVSPHLDTNKLDSTFDDMFSLLTSSVKTDSKDSDGNIIGKDSFPLFKSVPYNGKQMNAGYCGYLRDLYISTDLIEQIVNECRTVTSMMNSILKKISEYLCGVVDLKFVPHSLDGKKSTIRDDKFVPLYNPSDTIPTLEIGSSKHAFMTSVNMGVKMSQEMANQVMFEVGKSEIKPNSSEVTKPKTDTTAYGKYVQNDRLFKTITQTPTKVSRGNPKSDTAQREDIDSFKDGVEVFNIGDHEYYFTSNKNLMEKIVKGDGTPTAVYLNSAIMPGSTFEFETMGIGGFTFLGQFGLKNVPKQYAIGSAIWQISGVRQSIDTGTWKTTVSAQVRPMSFLSK